eukprot:gene24691-31064_t
MKVEKNYVSFAGNGKNSRSTQIFIAYQYSNFLGLEPWETPFGVVVRGQKTLNDIYRGYEDIPPHGNGPDQRKIREQGNDYIRREFPLVDFLHTCKIVKPKVKKTTKKATDTTKTAKTKQVDEVKVETPASETKTEPSVVRGSGEL